MQPILVLAKTLHAPLTESLTLKTSSIRKGVFNFFSDMVKVEIRYTMLEKTVHLFVSLQNNCRVLKMMFAHG